MMFAVLSLILLAYVYALDNGLALTPPMGWLSWEWFRCNVDCVAKPNDCLNEKLFTEMIDTLVSRGFYAHGYKQINIDDCWMSTQRNESGYLIADPSRFPNGMLYLSQYAHKRGVQLGIYEDFGTHTCQGYPGSMGYIDKDAELFGSWEVDSLKFDGCNSPTSAMHDGYTNMSIALNKTGRPILYACSWPAYDSSISFPYLETICNLWRPYTDIEHTWGSVSDIIKHWGDVQTRYQPANGPGHWVDPDMLIIGTPSTSLGVVEYKTQIAMWAIWAAPLYMSHDLRQTTDEVFEILTNDEIIAVDQDPLGVAGRMYFRNDIYEIWARPLDNGDVAVCIYNKSGGTINVDFDVHYIGLKVINKIKLRDLDKHVDAATLEPHEIYHITGLPGHGTAIYRISQI